MVCVVAAVNVAGAVVGSPWANAATVKTIMAVKQMAIHFVALRTGKVNLVFIGISFPPSKHGRLTEARWFSRPLKQSRAMIEKRDIVRKLVVNLS